MGLLSGGRGIRELDPREDVHLGHAELRERPEQRPATAAEAQNRGWRAVDSACVTSADHEEGQADPHPEKLRYGRNTRATDGGQGRVEETGGPGRTEAV